MSAESLDQQDTEELKLHLNKEAEKLYLKLRCKGGVNCLTQQGAGWLLGAFKVVEDPRTNRSVREVAEAISM